MGLSLSIMAGATHSLDAEALQNVTSPVTVSSFPVATD
jgi:hypothetical protein